MDLALKFSTFLNQIQLKKKHLTFNFYLLCNDITCFQ